MSVDAHQLAEARSLEIHRLIAEKLRGDTSLAATALSRVNAWQADESVHPFYVRAWHDLLSGPVERLLEMLTDPGEPARALRQCSPFAGVVDPRTRWRIWRDVRERFGT